MSRDLTPVEVTGSQQDITDIQPMTRNESGLHRNVSKNNVFQWSCQRQSPAWGGRFRGPRALIGVDDRVKLRHAEHPERWWWNW